MLSSLYALEAAKGMDFKLERVALALKALGDPQRRFPAVHIAGTNGKGSVAAMAHAICTAAGYRAGLYTSPHLVSFTERIRVGARSVSEAEVVALTREIRGAATARGIELTFFEFVTVMAFLHFARRRVDVAVVEVGLGGRLDATNVLDPAVTAITTIGLDHEEYLGSTLEAVAAEKAGIIKPGRPLIVGRVPAAAGAVLRATAAACGAPAYWLGGDFHISGDTPVAFRGMGHEIDGIELRLNGTYQRDNAATAVAAVLQLPPALPVETAAIRRGLAQVRWPGRLDVVRQAPLVVLDGAHNADGAAALARELPRLTAGRRIHLLFGVMRDKRWQPMVDVLGPLASRAVLTTVLPPRGERPERLAHAFARHCPVEAVEAVPAALQRVLAGADERDAVVVAGSLFLVGAVYPVFLHDRSRQSFFGRRPASLHP